MKQPFQPKLSDRLSSIAIALDSGNGEAQIAFSAAERLDELESKLRDVGQAALYLRSTLVQVASLLRGERLFGMAPQDDALDIAKVKSEACLRVVSGMDFWNIKGKK